MCFCEPCAHSRPLHQCRSNYQTDRDRELARNVPSAPPVPPPPPPPPPPPSAEPVLENEIQISRRDLALLMFGGTAAYWFAVRGGLPLAAVDKERNIALVKTRGGNLVAATQVGRLPQRLLVNTSCVLATDEAGVTA